MQKIKIKTKSNYPQESLSKAQEGKLSSYSIKEEEEEKEKEKGKFVLLFLFIWKIISFE